MYLESHFKFVYPIPSVNFSSNDFSSWINTTSWMKKAERKKKRRKDNWLAEIELPGFLDSITYAGFPNSEDRIGSRFESRRNPRCTSLASRTLARLPGWSQMAEIPSRAPRATVSRRFGFQGFQIRRLWRYDVPSTTVSQSHHFAEQDLPEWDFIVSINY